MEQNERIIDALSERLEKHDTNRKEVQDKLREICDGLRAQIDELEEKINSELEEKFRDEDTNIQSALNELRTCVRENTDDIRFSKAFGKAKASLVVEQSYALEQDSCGDGKLSSLYKLKTERQILLEWSELNRPQDIRIINISEGRICLEFARNIYEEDAINKSVDKKMSKNLLVYKALLHNKWNNSSAEYPLDNGGGDDTFSIAVNNLVHGATYTISLKALCLHKEGEWSEPFEFIVPALIESCTTANHDVKVCRQVESSTYEAISKTMKLPGKTQSIVTGSTAIPLNSVISWNIRILRTENSENRIYIGVAPADALRDTNKDLTTLGWFVYCHDLTLHSGQPHWYKPPGMPYGPRFFRGESVWTEGIVGVAMDTTKGELLFIVDGVDYGVAYRGIPLDRPLVPWVITGSENDHVEFMLSGVREIVNDYIPAPTGLATRSDSWDTMTFMWDAVPGALFYQVEVDGNNFRNACTTNTLTMKGFHPGTAHDFRVRIAQAGSVGMWSAVGSGRTQSMNFKNSVWKECTHDIYSGRKYSIDPMNPRIATKMGYGRCTVIGDSFIPARKVTSWRIKVLKTQNNNWASIYVGVAPFDIDRNNNENFTECGWYFCCISAKLFSGPPQYYRGKTYGKISDTVTLGPGNFIEVVVNTIKREVSYVLRGKSLGPAYTDIFLDKPLVPSVVLAIGGAGDTIELEIPDEDAIPGSDAKKSRGLFKKFFN